MGGIDAHGLTPLVQVFDMPEAIHFYCDLLGFEIGMRSDPEAPFDWALLRLGGAELMLNTAYEAPDRPPAPDPARIAAHGDVTLYIACADVDAAFAVLRERGVAVTPPVVQGYGMKQLEIVDRDGYRICFQQPAR